MKLIKTILNIVFVVAGLVAIYLGLSQVFQSTNLQIQKDRDAASGAVITYSYVSNDVPFGEPTHVVKRDSQIFYNMHVKRIEGQPCFVKTTWRWVLHLPQGRAVMWNKSDGEFYAGDKTEELAQAVEVPARLVVGDYTLSRLSVFRCGDVEEYARVVRNVDIHVE